MIKLKDLLLELSNDEVKSWALDADIYEKIFRKIKDKRKLDVIRKKLLKVIKNRRRQKSVEYFYDYRLKQL